MIAHGPDLEPAERDLPLPLNIDLLFSEAEQCIGLHEKGTESWTNGPIE